MRLAAYFEPYTAYFEPYTAYFKPFAAFFYSTARRNIGERYAPKGACLSRVLPDLVRKTGKFRPYHALFALLGCEITIK